MADRFFFIYFYFFSFAAADFWRVSARAELHFRRRHDSRRLRLPFTFPCCSLFLCACSRPLLLDPTEKKQNKRIRYRTRSGTWATTYRTALVRMGNREKKTHKKNYINKIHLKKKRNKRIRDRDSMAPHSRPTPFAVGSHASFAYRRDLF